MTDYVHIAPQFRDVMFKSDSDRIEFLDYARWIDYRAGKELLDLLHGLLRKPERPRMPNLFVVGESNCGKTTVIEQFISKAGSPYLTDDAVNVRPVIYVEVHKPDERGSTLPSCENSSLLITPSHPWPNCDTKRCTY